MSNLKTIIMEKRITEEGKSYWDGNGAYQTEYDKLYEELVPSSGEADTVHGEMIRAASRLFYDYCNNGNCNVREITTDYCDECGGSGYEEHEEPCWCGGDEEAECDECDGSGTYIETSDCQYCGGECYVPSGVEINGYYQDMIDFLAQHLNDRKVVENIERFIKQEDLGYGDYTFSDDEMKVYNNLVDAVMHQVLNEKNTKRLV
jgi:hypothetical protein